MLIFACWKYAGMGFVNINRNTFCIFKKSLDKQLNKIETTRIVLLLLLRLPTGVSKKLSIQRFNLAQFSHSMHHRRQQQV